MGEAYLMRRSGGQKGSGIQILALEGFDNKPASPAENTIAIVSDQAIAHTYIQNSAPEGVDGAAYISLARPDKEIEIADGISIGVSGAHVYKDSAWVFADTYLFKDGAWGFLWSGQLYSPQTDETEGVIDDEYTAYTGGFAAKGMKAASNSTASAGAPDVTREEGCLTADTAAEKTGGILYTTQTIDLTPYKTLVFEGEFTRGGSVERNFTACVWSGLGSYYTSNLLAYTQPSKTSFTSVDVDISGVNAQAYVGLGLTQSTAKITRAYLIPKDV